MQKTFCDRCGREIMYGETASVTYSNPGSHCKGEVDRLTALLGIEHLDLCQDCADDFKAFMEETPLREEAHAKEPTGSP